MKKWITSKGQEIVQLLKGKSNVYLVINGENAILVDTSTSRVEKQLLLKLKKMLSISKSIQLRALIFTHVHYDHVQNAAGIINAFQPQLIVHSTEAVFLQQGYTLMPQGTNSLTKRLVNFANTHNLYRKSILNFNSITPDILVGEKYDLSSLGISGYILHVPGHTIGSLALILDHEIAIVGDSLFGIFKNSVFPPFSNDVPSMIRSWNRLLDTRCSLFLPGHGNERDQKILQKEYEKYKKRYGVE